MTFIKEKLYLYFKNSDSWDHFNIYLRKTVLYDDDDDYVLLEIFSLIYLLLLINENIKKRKELFISFCFVLFIVFVINISVCWSIMKAIRELKQKIITL